MSRRHEGSRPTFEPGRTSTLCPSFPAVKKMYNLVKSSYETILIHDVSQHFRLTRSKCHAYTLRVHSAEKRQTCQISFKSTFDSTDGRVVIDFSSHPSVDKITLVLAENYVIIMTLRISVLLYPCKHKQRSLALTP